MAAMRRSEKMRAGFLWAAAGGTLVLLACDRMPEPVETGESSSTLVSAASKEEKDGDRPSAQAINAVWRTAGTPSDSLTGSILNATAEDKSVTVKVVGFDPYGREVSRSLGRKTVKARSSLDLAIPMKDLPVQSVGHASSVSLAVTYDHLGRRPDGSTKTFAHEVHSSVAYVTFASDFSKATARTVGEQGKANAKAEQARLRSSGPEKLRHYNATYDRIDEVAALPESGEPPVLHSVTEVAPGPLPSLE